MGDGREITLASPQTVLTDRINWSGSPTIQRDANVGHQWLTQRPRGNASLSLTFATLHAHDSIEEAEIFAHDHKIIMLTNPLGTIIHQHAYKNHHFAKCDHWIAGLTKIDILPITADNILSIDCRWSEVKYEFVLTK